MFKTVLNRLVLVVMLVTFLGQIALFTNVMSCATSVTQETENFTKLVTDNPFNLNEQATTTDCCTIDCCDNECICINYAGSAFAYLPAETSAIKALTVTGIQSIEPFLLQKLIPVLRYRPPIFMS